MSELIQTTSEADFLRLITVFMEMGDAQQIRSWRSDILMKLHKSITLDEVTTFDCGAARAKYVNELLSPVLPSMTSSLICNCPTSKIKQYPTLPLSRIKLVVKTVEKLPELIRAKEKDFEDIEKTCRVCKNKKKKVVEFGDVVVITVIYPKLFKCDDIPKEFPLKGQRYGLRSTIDYGGLGHVISRCLRKDNKWYVYDDNQRNVKESSETCEPYILFYEREWPKL